MPRPYRVHLCEMMMMINEDNDVTLQSGQQVMEREPPMVMGTHSHMQPSGDVASGYDA